MWEMQTLAPISYYDPERSIRLECYADTMVYQKKSKTERKLVAIRMGGYPESVRALCDAMHGGISVESVVDRHNIILKAEHKRYRRQFNHDGIYAEATLTAVDDEADEMLDEEQMETDNPNAKRKMYIFCEEGDTDSLFDELDKKTSVPLLPGFKEYILDECLKQKILLPLEVVSSSTRFDAYLLQMSNDEKEMIAIVNRGLKTGQISIPNAADGKGFETIATVSQYLNTYGVNVANRIKNSFHPLFDPAAEDICKQLKDINGYLFTKAGYSLYPAQLAVAESLKRRLDQAKVGLVIAECGSGKTKIGTSALAAHQNGRKCLNVVLSPAHVAKKWVREIEETLPDTKAAVVHNLADINRVYSDYQNGDKSVYLIMSKERARDGYMKRPGVTYSKSKRGYICPDCGKVIEMEVKEDGSHYIVNADQFFFRKENSQNHKCKECGQVLWTVCNPNDRRIGHNQWVKIGGYGFVYRRFARRHLEKTKDEKVLGKLWEIINNPERYFPAKSAYVRYSMSKYIAEKLPMLDGVILDELHLYKGDSGQGNAMETLIGCSKKVIGMTATLINGYSSGLFYLLYRIVPFLMQEDHKSYDDPSAFNTEYGVTENTYELEEDEEYNANSRHIKRKLRERLLPGVSPLVFSRFLIDCAAFLSLSDMGKHLPDYEEIPVELHLRQDVREEYERLESFFSNAAKSKDGNFQKIKSSFMSLLTTYPDQPYHADPIYYPGSDTPAVDPKDLSSIDELHEKDIAVLDIVERKVKNGERVLVYTSWVKIDTQEKLLKILSERGYRAAVLEQRVKPEKREEWVAKQVEKGIDVLITNPSLVETGLDLNDFTTLIYYNIGYNLFTFRQSSRRSWRINQKAPRIEVYLLYYHGVLQERAITLMASKLAAATLVEGNFSDEGLAAMGDCRDLTSQLARELTLGIRDEVEDTAALFKKMAVIKDAAQGQEDLSHYMNLPKAEKPEDTETKTVAISVSEKLARAKALANQAQSARQSISVQKKKLYETAAFEQLSLFDLAG